MQKPKRDYSRRENSMFESPEPRSNSESIAEVGKESGRVCKEIQKPGIQQRRH